MWTGACKADSGWRRVLVRLGDPLKCRKRAPRCRKNTLVDVLSWMQRAPKETWLRLGASGARESNDEEEGRSGTVGFADHR